MKPEQDPRWVTVYDEYGDLSGQLVGSKEGLQHLRDTIDRALAAGEAKANEDISFFFESVKVESKRPEKKEYRSFGDFVAKVAFLSLIACGVILLFLGASKLWEILAR